jgi:hypothetical protein
MDRKIRFRCPGTNPLAEPLLQHVMVECHKLAQTDTRWRFKLRGWVDFVSECLKNSRKDFKLSLLFEDRAVAEIARSAMLSERCKTTFLPENVALNPVVECGPQIPKSAHRFALNLTLRGEGMMADGSPIIHRPTYCGSTCVRASGE